MLRLISHDFKNSQTNPWMNAPPAPHSPRILSATAAPSTAGSPPRSPLQPHKPTKSAPAAHALHPRLPTTHKLRGVVTDTPAPQRPLRMNRARFLLQNGQQSQRKILIQEPVMAAWSNEMPPEPLNDPDLSIRSTVWANRAALRPPAARASLHQLPQLIRLRRRNRAPDAGNTPAPFLQEIAFPSSPMSPRPHSQTHWKTLDNIGSISRGRCAATGTGTSVPASPARSAYVAVA